MMLDPNKVTSRTFVGRLVRLPLRLIPGATVLPILSGPNKGARWKTGSSVAGCWVGTYEAEKARLLARVVLPGMTVWDVGANAGYYTLLFSRAVGESGRVVAFEPFAGNAKNLVDHVAWNAVHNTQVVQVAVAAGTSLTGFQIGTASNSTGHLVTGQRGYLVPTISLDQCVEVAGLNSPDLVKMDIEGAEAEALRGAAGILRARRTAWYISLHGDDARRDCDSLLRSAGYSITDLAGNPLPEALIGYDGDEIVGHPPGFETRSAR